MEGDRIIERLLNEVQIIEESMAVMVLVGYRSESFQINPISKHRLVVKICKML